MEHRVQSTEKQTAGTSWYTRVFEIQASWPLSLEDQRSKSLRAFDIPVCSLCLLTHSGGAAGPQPVGLFLTIGFKSLNLPINLPFSTSLSRQPSSGSLPRSNPYPAYTGAIHPGLDKQ